MSPLLIDQLFTLFASAAVLGVAAVGLVALPWGRRELDEAVDATLALVRLPRPGHLQAFGATEPCSLVPPPLQPALRSARATAPSGAGRARLAGQGGPGWAMIALPPPTPPPVPPWPSSTSSPRWNGWSPATGAMSTTCLPAPPPTP